MDFLMTLMRVGRGESVMGVQALKKGGRGMASIFRAFIREYREGVAARLQCRGPACLVNVKGLDVFPVWKFRQLAAVFSIPGKNWPMKSPTIFLAP